jgi:protein O-mannosyl-transferase
MNYNFSVFNKTKLFDFKLLTVFYFLILCFLLYGNTIPNKYSIDDDLVTANNEMVKKGVSGIPKIFTTLYQNMDNFKYEYRPIVKLSYALEFEIFGSNPGISHFINILLYFLSSVLLFFILRKVFYQSSLIFPLIIVTLFIAHPIHTEVVASLKNRDELLSFFFSLITLICSIKLGETQKKIYFIPAFLSFAVALLSKQSALVYAALCPLTLLFIPSRTKFKSIVFLFLLLLSAYFLMKLTEKGLLGRNVRDKFFWDNPLYFYKSIGIRSATGMRVLLFYLKIMILPTPLLFYYGYNMIPVSHWNNWQVIIIFLFHLGLFILGIYLFRKKNPIGYGILFYLIAISMFTNIVRPAAGIVAERYIFTSVLGFCIVLSGILFSISKVNNSKEIKTNKKLFLGLIVLLILVPYSYKTISRNAVWKDYNTLYANDIKYLENSAKANELYASELARQVNEDMLKTKDLNKNMPKIRLAVKYFEKSLRIDSSNFMANNNLGLIYFVIFKDNQKALTYFKRSIQYRPDYGRGNFNMALTYERKKDFDSAIIYYDKMMTIEPNNQNVYINLANIYFDEKHDLQKAVDILDRFSKADPDNALPFVSTGTYYLRSVDTVSCLKYFDMAAEKPNIDARFLNALARIYASKGLNDKAAYYNLKAQNVKLNKKIKKN